MFFKWIFQVSHPSFSGAPPPILYKNIQENGRLFFFPCNSVWQRKRSLGHEWEVETQDWIISGLGVFFHPSCEKQTGLELDKSVVLRGFQRTGEGWKVPERTIRVRNHPILDPDVPLYRWQTEAQTEGNFVIRTRSWVYRTSPGIMEISHSG